MSDAKNSTPEEIAEMMEAYRRQTGHYPPAVMMHPHTLKGFVPTSDGTKPWPSFCETDRLAAFDHAAWRAALL